MKRAAPWLLGGALLLSACAGLFIRRERFSWVEAQAADALARVHGVFLLDVSSRRDYAGGHILGFANIPYHELWPRLAELPQDKDTPLLVVCQDGERAAWAAALLRDEGYTRVYALKGGLKRWRAAGLPTVPGIPPSRRGEPGV